MAQQIAAEKRAKLLELIAPGFGTTVGGWLKSQWTGIFQSNVETEIPSAVFSSRNVVYLGFPIWYWHAASPLRSFVERSQFDKTCVVLFATMESSYSESSIQEFRQWLNRHGAEDGGVFTAQTQVAKRPQRREN